MKKQYLILLVAVALIFAFSRPATPDTIIEDIKVDYASRVDAFNVEVDRLLTNAQKLSAGQVTVEALQDNIINTRLAYKRVEHFVEYFQAEGATRYINGAPLPKINTAAPEHDVIPPLGLQTLDETIFANEPDAGEIENLAKELKKYWSKFYPLEMKRRLEHRYVFEAFRFQVIRIFTLGLTGFDTPGSVNAIPEAIASLETMATAFGTYKKMAPVQVSKLMEQIDAFIQYLEANNDFDTLDRMHVIRTFINPLYADIYTLQKGLNIEFAGEVDPTHKAVNYHQQQIFDEAFLNKSFYSQIASSDLDDPKKIELGRILFFDPVLSNNLEMSCATCHQPDKAFTDGLSKSITNKTDVTTLRNAPTLINSAYAEKYFYDLREYDLERQVKHVVYDKNEFNIDFIDLADRMRESEEYVKIFKDVYGDRDKYIISSWSISNALAAYVASLSSWNSDFDQYARGETDQYPESAIRGFNLFMGKAACGTCHFAPVFNGTVPPKYAESEVLGVPTTNDTINVSIDPDLGRMVNGRTRDQLDHFAYSFKTTTVRNVALTAPYMHNGVYNTLDEVVDFYNRGGGAGMGMDLEHQTLPFDNLSLNKQEMKDIVAFMETLTDTTGMTIIPKQLPKFATHSEWNSRKIGGSY
ncbi:MAG: cytochrome c peroxidase [Bacteroidota bacterium]